MLASTSATRITQPNAFLASLSIPYKRQAIRRSFECTSRVMATASSNVAAAATASEPIRLKAKRVTAEDFKPFGQARPGLPSAACVGSREDTSYLPTTTADD